MTARPVSLSSRIQGLIIASILGWFLSGQVRSAWAGYWLLKDPQAGMAVVTARHWSGHNAMDYRYTVNGKNYAGVCGRNWQDPRYSRVEAGEESIVYFSASHPWISCLYKPKAVIEGLPVIVIVLFIEALAIVTIVNPESRWAFNFNVMRWRRREANLS